MTEPPSPMPVHAALDRLLAVAATDTGQARRVANLLLAWANSHTYGGFDPTDLWAVSDPVRADMLELLSLIAADRHHASAYGHDDAFETLARRWRSHAHGAP